MSTRRLNTRTIATAAVFTAFVAAATSVFSVFIPATTGYFNVGEVMVYTAALLTGPYVGAFAGGTGSMLSDISLGYPQYAPGTLVIKGIEGFIVGYLSTRAFRSVTKRGWRAITLGGAAFLALGVSYIGTTYLSGEFSPTLGGAWYIPAVTAVFVVPPFFWVGLSVVAFLGLMLFGLRAGTRSGLNVVSVLLGGSEMVTGYFLYESFALGLGVVTASAEVPFNVAQALVGLLVAVPLARSIRRIVQRSSPSDGKNAAGVSVQEVG